MRKIWNVAIYARVSTDKKEQQESIPAQVQSLKKWLIDRSKDDTEAVYNVAEVYEDAGFSGSNFERDSFIRMKDDIEKGKVNMVLTRDLSRFARNYIVAGYYIEDYFKANGVRFVSVLDNVDTIQEANDIVPFKNILNEMYIRDCSRRTRDGLKQRMIRGSCISSKPPYGYKFVENHNNNIKTIGLVPANDETEEVVKKIFKLYQSGWGVGRISTYLNSEGISQPCARIKKFARNKFNLWTNNTILSILTNPKYGGMMVQGQYKKLSYKIKKIKKVPEEEWIHGGEFQGIIKKSTFIQVQDLIKKRSKSYRYKGEVEHPFSTVLCCGECGGSMSYRKGYEGYKCTNSQMGGSRCTSHSVKEDFIKQKVIEGVIQYIDSIKKDKIYDSVKALLYEKQTTNKELQKIENQIKTTDNEFERVYQDKLSETINQRNFEIVIKRIQQKQEILIKRENELKSLCVINNADKDWYNLYKNKIESIFNLEEFDRITVESLVDKIIVSEERKTKEKKVYIYFKFHS